MTPVGTLGAGFMREIHSAAWQNAPQAHVVEVEG